MGLEPTTFRSRILIGGGRSTIEPIYSLLESLEDVMEEKSLPAPISAKFKFAARKWVDSRERNFVLYIFIVYPTAEQKPTLSE